jgi:hypothetical protein
LPYCPFDRMLLIKAVHGWHVGVSLLATFSNIADFGNSLDELSLTIFVEGNGAIATLLGWLRGAIVDCGPLVKDEGVGRSNSSRTGGT